MELKNSVAPFFRLRDDVRSLMLDRLIAMAALLLAAIVFYGFRAFLMATAGAFGAVLVEWLWNYVAKKTSCLNDLSAVASGVLCALLMPANLPLWAPLLAAAMSTAVVKLAFGGLGRCPFNDTAVGYCFTVFACTTVRGAYNSALLSTGEQLVFRSLPQFSFGYAKGFLPAFANVRLPQDAVSSAVIPTALLRAGVDPGLSAADIFLGRANSAMGGALFVLVIACGVWLYCRGSLAWQGTLSYIISMIVLSFLFSWDSVTRPMSVVYDLATGSTLLCAVFLLGDLLTAPHMRSGRIIYGSLCAVLTVILRRTGSVEGGEIFALLLCNALAASIDSFVWKCRGCGISLGGVLNKLANTFRKKLGLGPDPFDSIGSA